MSSTQANFETFNNNAATNQEKQKKKSHIFPVKHLQLRVRSDDARRVKRAAEDRGFETMQSMQVEAINKLLAEWGLPPVADIGTSGSSVMINAGSQTSTAV